VLAAAERSSMLAVMVLEIAGEIEFVAPERMLFAK
jgi:hypothetical protein